MADRLPHAQISLRGPCRLHTFEMLLWLISVDAYNTAGQLRSEGWGGDALEAGLDHYRRWILEQMADAVDVGMVFWRSAA